MKLFEELSHKFGVLRHIEVKMQLESHDLNSLRKLVRDLQEENERLKAILKDNNVQYDATNVFEENITSTDVYDPDQGARIIKYVITREMAKFFFYMFHGREDVYAKRGKNGGYFPQCENRWNRICPKNNDVKTFCDDDCPYRKWKKIELDVLESHLIGKRPECDDVLGTYPLFTDNTCRFLVFDFDNHVKDSYKTDDANTDDLWKSEVDALRKILKSNNIDALTERSRSGRGAHSWIFFDKPIQASVARNFGFALLDRGAISINMPAFKYYDRMYPSQDVLSKIGNLVALPLQGRALENGNSAFIDENWNAYPDQWETLRKVRKIPEQEIIAFIQIWNKSISSSTSITKYADKQMRPWKRAEKFSKSDVVGNEIHIILDDGVYVDALNLLPNIQNQIKRMATIDNPEFYANKRQGRSNYYNFRQISLWSEAEGYIRVPRGMLDKLEDKCKESGIKFDITDKRQFGRPIRVSFNGTLKEQQEYAVARLENYENGVLCAATAFGKTVLAAYMIAKRKVSTLILLQNTELLPQWISEFEKFLIIDEKPPKYHTKSGREKVRESVIGTLQAGNDKTTGIIDFALVGSAYHKGEFFENIDSYGMVIFDECHHAASGQAQAVLGRIRAKYVYGLSATPGRSDKLDDIVYMMLGEVRHKYTAKEQADEQGIERLLVPRFTRVVNATGEELDIIKADKLIVDNAVRNEQIKEDVKAAIASGRTPLILTKLKKHVDVLKDVLRDCANHVFVIYGDNSKKQNAQIREKMSNTPENESLILIATASKVGEGFNFPRLDTLMLAAPVKYEGRLTQYVGRLNRTYEGKKDVLVYDYVDSHIRFFDRQYKNRLKTYKELGYKIYAPYSQTKQITNAIYDRKDYEEVFFRDLIEADKNIVISSPKLVRSKVTKLISMLKPRQEEGITVTVITMEPNSIGYEDVIESTLLVDELHKGGIIVRETKVVEECYAVIDNQIVWHGGMNLLGKAEAWDNLMRVENDQVAAELLEISEKRL